MLREHTCSIIKPNAVAKNLIGAICTRLESSGFKIIAIKMTMLTKQQAQQFYAEHQYKHFFNELIDFMISGPIVVSILEHENAVQRYRALMGETNPIKAVPGTLRSDYADDYTKNSVHGSDSLDSANREINFFFDKDEIFSRSS